MWTDVFKMGTDVHLYIVWRLMLNERRVLEVLPYLENRVSLRVYSTNDIIFTNLMSIIFKLLNMHNNNNILCTYYKMMISLMSLLSAGLLCKISTHNNRNDTIIMRFCCILHNFNVRLLFPAEGVARHQQSAF